MVNVASPQEPDIDPTGMAVALPRRDASRFSVRRGSERDTDLLVSMFDDSVAWLVARGFTAQWGSTPFSEVPRQVERCRRWATTGRLWFCESNGSAVGALVLDTAPSYVPTATEPETYVAVLVTAHTADAKGAGALLLDVADQQAREDRVGLVRVDCFAGNGGALVRFYESCGFQRLTTFEVDGWSGQVLGRRTTIDPQAVEMGSERLGPVGEQVRSSQGRSSS